MEPDTFGGREIFLPVEEDDASLPPLLSSNEEEKSLRMAEKAEKEKPVAKEVKVRPKSLPVQPVVSAGKGEERQNKEQIFDLDDFFYGKKLPLALIAAEVFSPPRSRRRFR